MKRSFYEMLGIPHDADQAKIDAAYADVTRKLNSTTSVRGTTEAMTELTLIRDGYQILSNPAKRALYDAKLMADETGVQLMFFPEGTGARKKLGVETLVFATLASVFCGIIYYQLSTKVAEVRIEHVQAVTRHREAQTQPVSMDPAAPNPPDVHVIVKEEKK